MRLRTHHARVLAAREAVQDWQDLERRLTATVRLLRAGAMTLAPHDAVIYEAKADGVELALDFLREYPVRQP